MKTTAATFKYWLRGLSWSLVEALAGFDGRSLTQIYILGLDACGIEISETKKARAEGIVLLHGIMIAEA